MRQGSSISMEDAFVLAIVAMLIVPTLIPQAREHAVSWLLGHQILVPAHEALLTVPTTGAGVDLRRLAVLLIGLVLIWALIRMKGSQR